MNTPPLPPALDAPAARELRRLDAISMSPIYAAFSEAADGAATIRAYRSQAHFHKVWPRACLPLVPHAHAHGPASPHVCARPCPRSCNFSA
jgi:hypothetical protein